LRRNSLIRSSSMVSRFQNLKNATEWFSKSQDTPSKTWSASHSTLQTLSLTWSSKPSSTSERSRKTSETRPTPVLKN
jgi:hypothetical protein